MSSDIEAMLAEMDEDDDYDEEFPETEVSEESDTRPAPTAEEAAEFHATYGGPESLADLVAEPEPGQQRRKGEPRKPCMSGHCAYPQTAHPEESHERCARNGAGNRAVPRNKHGVKEFAPCPCACHLGDEYECGNCGRIIRETHYWTGDGEVTYVHVDNTGTAIGEECP